jgi:hypothetical protein
MVMKMISGREDLQLNVSSESQLGGVLRIPDIYKEI